MGQLPDGIVKAVVREFTPFGEREHEVGHIDVVFIGKDGVEVCHHEFRVEVTGRGGFVVGQVESRGESDPGVG